MSDDLPNLAVAIEGIREMTTRLNELREVRARYARTFGIRASRTTFAELDKALKALRKAAR